MHTGTTPEIPPGWTLLAVIHQLLWSCNVGPDINVILEHKPVANVYVFPASGNITQPCDSFDVGEARQADINKLGVAGQAAAHLWYDRVPSEHTSQADPDEGG